MNTLFIIIVWLFFVAANVLLAEWNSDIVDHRIKNGNPKQIEHFYWFLGYCILCAVPFYISRNWWQLFSLLLLHGSVFPTTYNRFRGNPAFNLSKTSQSLFDQTLVKIGFRSTEEVNIIAFCLSVIMVNLQIFHV